MEAAIGLGGQVAGHRQGGTGRGDLRAHRCGVSCDRASTREPIWSELLVVPFFIRDFEAKIAGPAVPHLCLG
jgi:hypothetical protein